MADAIVLRDLNKSFGETVAVRNLNLTVPQGALYGVIGPNGAGKTTSIRMMLSILFPDSGELSILGRKSALEAKDRIGYLPEERGLYKKMRVGPFLTYMARLKGVESAQVKPRVKSWLERVELASVEGKRCEELSKGMQQKIQFIASVIHEPDLLILDEPFSGLDPMNQRLLRELVMGEHRRGATILFSTHVMIHAEQLCDHVVMIHRGEKVLDDTLTGIRAKFDPRTILFEPLEPGADVDSLRRVAGVASMRKDGAAWEVALAPGARVADVIPALASKIAPSRVELRRPTLEDVFIAIVADGDGAGGEEGERLRAAVREGHAAGVAR